MAKWDFLMSQSRDGASCSWRWRKTEWDRTVTRSTRSFPSYEACVADAVASGYDSSLPTVITRSRARQAPPASPRSEHR
jgi:hypothetical protein